MKNSLTALAITLVVGCSSAQDWVRSPPAKLSKTSNWQNVSHCEIKKEYLDSYLERLRSKSLIKVSPDLVKNLCTQPTSFANTKEAFIVRALFIGEHTGEYTVSSHEGSIWVNHESLASSSTKIKKSALVLLLDQAPDRVYVTAYADE